MKYTITLLLLFPLFLTAQQRLYVNHTANGQQTGLSWTDAFPRLEQALALAQPGDEVWVAKGLYVPDTAAWRNATFAPRSGVRLLGGFAGTEAVADDRDPVQYPTILVTWVIKPTAPTTYLRFCIWRIPTATPISAGLRLNTVTPFRIPRLAMYRRFGLVPGCIFWPTTARPTRFLTVAPFSTTGHWATVAG